MNDENTTQEELPTEANDETPMEIIGDEFAELKKFVIERGVRMLMAVLIGLIVVGGISFIKSSKQNKLNMASELLSNARSVQDLESVVSGYASTPAAPLALMKIAKMHYNNENIDIALNQYNEFQLKYPEHQLFLSAEMGKINCIESKGLLEDALAGYSKYLTENADYFLTPQAVLGKARCLKELGRKDEAIQVYEEYLAENPENTWAPLFEEKLDSLTGEKK